MSLKYKVVNEYGMLSDLSGLLCGEVVGLDFETTAKRPQDASLVGIGVSLSDGRAYYIPVGHRELVEDTVLFDTTYRGKTHKKDGERYTRTKSVPREWEDCPLLDGQVSESDAYDFLRRLCVEAKQIIAHNLKYELMCLRKWMPGIEVSAETDCSMIAHWLMRSEFAVRHGLKPAVKREFDHDMTTYSDVVKGQGNKQIAFSDLDECARYCCDDAYQCLLLWEKCRPVLDEDDLHHDYEKLEMPILDMLVRMEERGVSIDQLRLKNLRRKVDLRQEKVESQIEKAIYELSGGLPEVPHKSPKGMSELLYDHIGLAVPPTVKKGKTDQRSVSKAALTWWEKEGSPLEQAFATARLEWSELEAIRARFTDNILALISTDGRLRANNNQMGTETGRFSMNDPNLQNIPSRTQLGKEVRESFIASPGYKLIVADYSQLEPRIATHFSQDPALLDIYNNGKDIYLESVKMVTDRTGLELTRSQGKVLVLAMNYGMEASTLAKSLGVERAVAKEIFDAFYGVYAGFAKWKQTVINYGRKTGYARTLLLRRRYIPELLLSPHCDFHPRTNWNCGGCKTLYFRVARGERQMVNTVIQGSAADIVKLSMRNVDRRFQADNNKWDAHVLFQVHDEIIAECKEEGAEEVSEWMKFEMENVYKNLRVPLVTEPTVCDRWSEAK